MDPVGVVAQDLLATLYLIGSASLGEQVASRTNGGETFNRQASLAAGERNNLIRVTARSHRRLIDEPRAVAVDPNKVSQQLFNQIGITPCRITVAGPVDVDLQHQQKVDARGDEAGINRVVTRRQPQAPTRWLVRSPTLRPLVQLHGEQFRPKRQVCRHRVVFHLER